MSCSIPCPQVVIAMTDSHCRDNLVAVLKPERSLAVAGEACDRSSLLSLLTQLRPDILLVDSALAGMMDGTMSSWPALRVVLLAKTIDEALVLQGLRLPARGILPASASRQTVLNCIQAVLADQYWLGMETVAVLTQMVHDLRFNHKPESAPWQQGLTRREGDIVAMIAAGRSNRQISRELCISERTVKHHLTSIFEKLGLSSRLQLAAFVLTHRVGSGSPESEMAEA